MLIRFRVKEGPRCRVDALEFRGNEHLGSDDLAACFRWTRGGWFGLGERIFTDAALAEGVDCVLTRYRLDGFAFAEVVPEAAEDASGSVSVAVQVSEGPRVFLREGPTLEGNEAFSSEQLREVLGLELPAPWSPRLPLLLQGRLVDHYRIRGYLKVQVDVEPQIDRERGEATVAVKVVEGPPVSVRDVVPVGNEITAAWVILGRMKLRAGDLYDEELVRQSYRSLLRSGLFSSVHIATDPVESREDETTLRVLVKEKARWRASLLAGWGSYELLRGKAVLEDINFFGSGHRVALEGKGSFRGYGASGHYTNPFVFTDSLSHLAQGFYEVRENPSFTEEQYGAETGLSHQLTERIQNSLFYRLKESDASEVDEDIPPELRQDVLLSSFIASTLVDYRNSVLDPDRGSSHRVTVEYASGALGSQLDFVRLVGSTAWFVPLWLESRLVASARAGAIVPIYDSQVIPVQERFYLGGEYTIRSFRQDEAGPKVNGSPIGGEAYTLFNVELRVPLPILRDLHFATFFDAGSLTEQVEDFAGGRYLFGVGAGIRYSTPFGPLRLDGAFNPDRERGEDLFVLHFGLGYPF